MNEEKKVKIGLKKGVELLTEAYIGISKWILVWMKYFSIIFSKVCVTQNESNADICQLT